MRIKKMTQTQSNFIAKKMTQVLATASKSTHCFHRNNHSTGELTGKKYEKPPNHESTVIFVPHQVGTLGYNSKN